MKRWFRSVIDVRKGEILLTTLMVIYIYLILVTYYFLKPARDSLFLSKLGAEQIPIVFILIALVVVPITTLYSRASRSLKLKQLINLTSIIIIVNLFILRWLFTLEGQDWVFYVFYIWVSIYGALTTSQFWLFANAVYDAAQAKRIFVLFSLAAIIGAFSGGSVTSLIVSTLGVTTENLLFFCAGFLVICILLVNMVWGITRKSEDQEAIPAGRRKEEPRENWAEMFKDIKASHHLQLIMGIIAMTMATASFVDYQFKFVSLDAFTDPLTGQTDKESLTSFLGQFYGGLSLIGFLFQFLFSYRALKIFGVGGVILFLPFSQIIASIFMIISPGLVAGVLLRGSDGVFKYSIDKTARELLFLPIPLEVKKRSKVFIDLFIDRIFRGISGAVLLFFTSVMAFSVRQISIVVLVMLAIWIFFDLLSRKSYVNAFRQALDRGELDPEQLTFKINDASTVNHLIKSLESPNERQILYALSMLKEVHNDKLAPHIRRLLKHPNREIRRNAIQVLQNIQNGQFIGVMEKMLRDEAPEVRIEALQYIHQYTDRNRMKLLKEYLENDDFKLQSAALGCIANYGTEDEKVLIDERYVTSFLNYRGAKGETARLLLARALGSLAEPDYREYLIQLMKDSSPQVVREAIAGMGRTRDREFVPLLLKLLSDKNYRGDARKALSAYGSRILGTLNDYLTDKSVNFSIRNNIPRVFSRIPTQLSVDLLLATLTTVEPGIKHAIIRALNQLRNKYPALNFDEEQIRRAVQKETESYYEIYEILTRIGEEKKREAKSHLLVRALSEKKIKNREHIFNLLALQYPPKDISNAYQGIVSGQKRLHANAVEFLENTLDKEEKKYLMPILDEISAEDIRRKGISLFKINVRSKEEALNRLVTGTDPWLKACTIYSLDLRKYPALKPLIEEAGKDEDALVKETVTLVKRNEQQSGSSA